MIGQIKKLKRSESPEQLNSKETPYLQKKQYKKLNQAIRKVRDSSGNYHLLGSAVGPAAVPRNAAASHRQQ